MAPTLRVGDLVPYMTPINIASLATGFFTLYFIARCIYYIYFHPLSSYPGPKRAAISSFWISKHYLGGRYHQVVKELHDRYGTVVRTGPDQLSYCSSTSWKDIYGHVSGRKPFYKSGQFYNDGKAPNVVSAVDPHQHGKMRRLLSHGFSAKALAEQESIVQEYIDKFISQVNVYATGPEGQEMVKWYNFTTFDIIGDLAFGDPFGSLSDGKPHFWVANILESLRAGAWITVLNRSPILKALIPIIVPKSFMEGWIKHHEFSREKTIKRIESPNSRKDLMSGLVIKQKAGDEMTIDEMQSHAGVIIIAGSETTATLLSGLSYHLCKNPDMYKKLVQEIRQSFDSYEDINGLATEHLTYLKAVLDEGLRIYPPVPIGLPRISAGETVDGKYVPQGTEVFTSSWAATHSEDNFHHPEEFLPERWIDPDCKDKKQASQPFSLGTRVCLGRSLALMEMRIILCKMLWSYDMELVNPDYDWAENNRCHVLWKKPDLYLRYTRRVGVTVPPLDG